MLAGRLAYRRRLLGLRRLIQTGGVLLARVSLVEALIVVVVVALVLVAGMVAVRTRTDAER